MMPNDCSSHSTSTMITTTLRIDLMRLSMGMKELMTHRSRPTTTMVMIKLMRDMVTFVECAPLRGNGAVVLQAPHHPWR